MVALHHQHREEHKKRTLFPSISERRGRNLLPPFSRPLLNESNACSQLLDSFAADAPRWIQQPSSDYPSTRDSVQKQVILNAL